MHDVHGTGGGPTNTTTEDLSFDDLPSEGLYKVFFQYQRNGQVVTIPFVVRVS